MELVGLRVRHKLSGTGVITEQEGNKITVEFATKNIKCVYPDAFERLLVAEDAAIQAEILELINDLKGKAEQERQAKIEKSIADAEELRAEYAAAPKTRRRAFAGTFPPDYHAEHLSTAHRCTYQQVESAFGIRRTNFGRGCNPTEDAIVLISSIEVASGNFVYHDKWTQDGDYIFSGEGAKGDQKKTKNNSEIMNAKSNGKEIHLFVKFSSDEYYYQGIFEVEGYTYEDDRDENGNMRKEYKFRLRRKNNVARQNVAFKCNYCDGGKSESRVGFFGPCSVENIKNNVLVNKHEWCSKLSKCKEFLEGKVSYSDVEEEYNNCKLCYESVMLQKWKAEAGIVGSGVNKGKPMRMEKVQKNSLAVLTTRLPNASEEERFVFAVFLVDEAYDGDNRDAGYVTTNSKWKIELTPEEASKILFWNYYRCPNAPDVIKFGSGLHRYLSDEQAAQILRDIIEVKTDTTEKEFAKEFFVEFCKKVGIDVDTLPNNDGALCNK